MAELGVDSTYGHALYLAAKELNMVETILSEAKELKDLLAKETDLAAFLNTPVVPPKEKKEVLEKIFKGKLSEQFLNLLFVLADKGRARHLTGIIRAFEKETNEAEGFSKGKIYSVLPLTKEQMAGFERETGKLLKQNVKLENMIDTTLIGGIKIMIDGKIIDASIRNRLDNLSGMFL